MYRNAVLVCASMLVLAMVSGCGSGRAGKIEANRAPVTGTVTLDGTPLKGGSITFVSVADPNYRMTCMIKSDGSFKVSNAPSGDVLASVETETMKFSNPDGYVRIPQKYAKTNTSGLKATITKDDPQGQKLTFELKSK
jgi:hypothetical protein